MREPAVLTINGHLWHREPRVSFQFNASFIKARPLTIWSIGDWSPYHHITFFFRPKPDVGMDGAAWWANNVALEHYTHPDLVHLGTVTVDTVTVPFGSGFAWSGTYPEYVRSRHAYTVLAIADNGIYAVWGESFSWRHGPQRGLPDSPADSRI